MVFAPKSSMALKRKRGFKSPMSRPVPSKRLAAQVKQLMRMRQEKKFAEVVVSGGVGQVNNDAQGAFIQSILSTIGQGDGESQRIGNSITATGIVFKQQFFKDSSASGARRVRTHIVRTLDPSMSTTDILEAVFDVNPMSGVRDYFSNLNYTMMRDKRVKILGSAQTIMDTSGDSNPSTGIITIPVKFDDETIRYSADGETLPASIRYHCITTCDLGNRGSATSGLSVFVTQASTGLDVKGTARLWYTDA